MRLKFSIIFLKTLIILSALIQAQVLAAVTSVPSQPVGLKLTLGAGGAGGSGNIIWKRHSIGIPDRATISVSDLNGDGMTDVVVSQGRRNNPKPSDGVYWFEAPDWNYQRLSDPSKPIRWSLSQTVGDIDNDGDVDVIALSFDYSNVYLSINPGPALVNEPWPTIIIKSATKSHRDGERVELVDIDNDGYLDVLFPRGSPKEVRVLFNPSGVVTDVWKDKYIGAHDGSDAHDVLGVDIDKDGDLDVVVASGDGTPGTGSVYWYEHPDGNPRDGSWLRHKVSSNSTNYGGLQIYDVDKDGRQDILVTESHGSPGDIMWYKNPSDSTLNWTKFIIGKQYAPHAGLIVDVDNDGDKEYWVPDTGCCGGTPKGGIVLFEIGGDPKKPWNKNVVAASPQLCRQSRAADMDNDGDLDVVCGVPNTSGPQEVLWWENNMF